MYETELISKEINDCILGFETQLLVLRLGLSGGVELDLEIRDQRLIVITSNCSLNIGQIIRYQRHLL